MPIEARWVYTAPSAEQQAAAEALSLALAAPDGGVFPLPLAEVLVQRGITSFEAARAYVQPDLSSVPSPWLLRDMDTAVAALQACLTEGKPILVYGDYDVDGTTAVALVSYWFTRWDVAHAWYVPDRATEGYGLSSQGVAYAAEMGAGLIIALDCGITAHTQADEARALGIALVIVDHHLPAATLPAATAIIDPKRADCPYPFKELTGCLLANKLLTAFAESAGLPYDPLLRVDLLALSAACDLVPLTGENRVWVALGLETLRARPLPGLAALMRSATRKGDSERRWTVSDLVFQLGPRLNAAGRLHHARATVELLLSSPAEAEALLGEKVESDEPDADVQADALSAANRARQELQAVMVESAIELAEAAGGGARSSFVLWHAEWHPGIVGIVAAKLIERYHRPTVLLAPAPGEEGTVWKGSARSVEGFDLYAALSECSEYLTQFGGHAHAAGLSLPQDQLDAFAEAFERVASERLTELQRQPVLMLDATARLIDFTPKFTRLIQRLEPYGPGNLRPLFWVKGVRMKNARVVGSAHLRLSLEDVASRVSVEAIGFGLGAMLEIAEGAKASDLLIDLAAYPDFNTFRGKTEIQLVVKTFSLS
jgi:single-stranded-DNA-specific exonuclease